MMKVFIGVLLAISTSLGYAKVSLHRLKVIYGEIITVNKIRNAPKLAISYSPKWNAFYNKDKHLIIVNQGLLQAADEDMIATTLGHELTHAKYGHENFLLQSRKVAYDQEYLADLEGKKLTTKAGYSVCRGFYWIYKQHTKNAPKHPDSDKRYKRLGCI